MVHTRQFKAISIVVVVGHLRAAKQDLITHFLSTLKYITSYRLAVSIR